MLITLPNRISTLKTYLKEIIRRKDLLLYLVTSGLKAEHRNSFLGYIWWMLDPLLGIAVYYFLVVFVLGRGGEGYGPFLVVGLVVFRSISSTLSSSARSITRQSGIITQVYLPKAIFPIGSSFTQLINFCFGLLVIAVFLVFFQIMPGISILWLPLVLAIQLVFMVAASLIIGYICVFVRDVENIITHVNRLLRYGSPVIWESRMLPAGFEWVANLSPLTPFLTSYRNIILHNSAPLLDELLIILGMSILVIAFMLYFYKENEHRIIKVL